MFRIRRIYDDLLPLNKAVISEVQTILAERFAGLRSEEVEQLPEKLRNPFKQRFRSVLFVAEKGRGHVQGFALVSHDPQLKFAYLDYIASASGVIGRGVGAALYERVREEASGLHAMGVFFECLPDEPDHCRDPKVRKQNEARLRFYEQYGARPLELAAYRTPTRPGEDNDNYPYLVFDDLGSGAPLKAATVRQIVAAVLERKYSHLCSPEYIASVARGIKADPVTLRPPRYTAKSASASKPVRPPERAPIAMTVNDRHDIHHIRERGYVESPVRITAITRELEGRGLTEVLPVREYPLSHVLAVHDADFVTYLRRACQLAPEKKSVYPYVFPIRNAARPPKEMSVRAGYYCIDTFTPIHRNAFPAAKRAVDCTLTAADAILGGKRLAYSLVRPPGHHAERRSFGGFCYFSNAAIAAHHFSRLGRVAILDIDYHHGNGQQDIFYQRADVLTVSIHGNPDFAYPYFSGFADEQGEGDGEGFNLNMPLPEVQNGVQYRKALERALRAIGDFDPAFLVIALGLDPAKGDPTGTWTLTAPDFETNGRMIGEFGRPTLVVQEGGYRTRTLGVNARHFLTGLQAGADVR